MIKIRNFDEVLVQVAFTMNDPVGQVTTVQEKEDVPPGPPSPEEAAALEEAVEMIQSLPAKQDEVMDTEVISDTHGIEALAEGDHDSLGQLATAVEERKNAKQQADAELQKDLAGLGEPVAGTETSTPVIEDGLPEVDEAPDEAAQGPSAEVSVNPVDPDKDKENFDKILDTEGIPRTKEVSKERIKEHAENPTFDEILDQEGISKKANYSKEDIRAEANKPTVAEFLKKEQDENFLKTDPSRKIKTNESSAPTSIAGKTAQEVFDESLKGEFSVRQEHGSAKDIRNEAENLPGSIQRKLNEEADERFRKTAQKTPGTEQKMVEPERQPEDPLKTESGYDRITAMKYGTAGNTFETVKKYMPGIFHGAISQMELQNADKKADKLSIHLATTESQLKGLTERAGSLVKSIDNIKTEKMRELENDVKLTPQRKEKIKSQLENDLRGMEAELSQAKAKSEVLTKTRDDARIEKQYYESRRDKVADESMRKIQEKSAPHEAKVDVLENKMSELQSKIDDYDANIKACEQRKRELERRPNSKHSLRAIDKEIAAFEKSKSKFEKEYDKREARAIPLRTKIGDWKNQALGFENLKHKTDVSQDEIESKRAEEAVEESPAASQVGTASVEASNASNTETESEAEGENEREAGTEAGAGGKKQEGNQENRESSELVIQPLNSYISQWNRFVDLDDDMPKIEFAKGEKKQVIDSIVNSIKKNSDSKISTTRVTPDGFAAFLQLYRKQKNIQLNERQMKRLGLLLNGFKKKLAERMRQHEA